MVPLKKCGQDAVLGKTREGEGALIKVTVAFEFCFYPRQSVLERLIKGKGFFLS